MTKPKIAFICVHNSCRSQIAEAFGKVLAADVFESYSAGTETKPQICTECGYIIQVAQGHTHTLIKVDGTPATCTEEGVKDYWKCSECGKLFENKQGTAEITDTGIPAKGHCSIRNCSCDLLQVYRCL